MSKIVIIVVFIFWIAVSFFYANTLVNKNTNTPNFNKATNNQVLNTTQKNTIEAILSQHSTVSDCWIVIDTKVYDVTAAINLHPGGANEIIKNCGQDATEAFSSKDKLIPQDHSATAYAMLADYYIGEVADIVSSGKSDASSDIQKSDQNNSALNNTGTINYSLTSDTIAQHNTTSDCWVTSGNNVYNVTSYIRSHPGGAAAITSYCGGDVAAAFAAQGHSANAANILASYKIGTIGSSVDQTIIESVNNKNNNGFSGGGEYEEDDDEDWEEDD